MHASPLRIGGLEIPPSVNFQLKIQSVFSVLIRVFRGLIPQKITITITIMIGAY